uniref:ribosomal protein L2 n=1 Tax=Hymenidium linearilobum TaxID=584745 RepID=UPI001EDE4D8B|nr:ribosomal protein L2 [Hymenidium linearilobum]YP_010271446.1 ribosomal protein L2 [Hymenidium linearilobum]UKB87566.1 ribosomal protein L2 [Hymenidium linearilobum]UKB87567.1 ribosomal protein L2 [Hymenidium linearilobum]
MAIHLYKTSTPSTRNRTVDSRVKSNPRNNLIYGQHRCGKGRNARGIITAGHRGGGHKRLYRKIDFRRNEKDIYGRIVTIEYDPNRNAYICLIHYGDGEKRYILHPRGAIIGDTIVSGTEVPIKMGNALPLNMGVVKGGPQLGEKNPQPLGVILHLGEEVEKRINIVII